MLKDMSAHRFEQFEIKRNHELVVFTGESLFPGFFGGANGFRPSTVCPLTGLSRA